MNQGRLARIGAILVFMATSVVTHANNKVKVFPAVNGEYVVKLKSSTQPMSNTRLEDVLGGQIKDVVNAKERLVVVKRSIVETRDAVVQSLSHNPYVQYAEPNYIYHVVGQANSLPTDELFARLWGLKTQVRPLRATRAKFKVSRASTSAPKMHGKLRPAAPIFSSQLLTPA